MTVKVGEQAPDFELEAFDNGAFRNVSLRDYRGKWVVLFFWPLDFTFVCPTEIKAFNSLVDEFGRENAVVLGASVDSVHSHKAWCASSLGPVKFPMLSDFKKDVATRYGILQQQKGI